ncbi:CDP-diacylglycerol--glycerol-3-phosphate 3-phosphatidyltransferase [Metamycoplasma neophronis]|uniref:CDP-diacylglycerol--glycerol-3-phosphate 3-phosphatidyltransferase n=2 Tax=Metamycoplasma neophronis TaxID=872983 RepID=A0ABY2Z055_9BACT|nr:CDP-diacylglycerol--glycerol-3-phosphate 3-phosphatidyltransferase [Metamycoplasma neophronis]
MHKNKTSNYKPLKVTKFGVANWLTVLRLLLMIPFIALMTAICTLMIKNGGIIYYDKLTLSGVNNSKLTISIMYWLNVIIFIAAMITDFVDGHYARKTNTVSAFGKVFDPIADKVATTLMMIFLAITQYTFLPIVVLFIIRDILVDGSRTYAIKKNIEVAANWWGKIKTIIVSFALIAVAFAGPWLANPTLSTKHSSTELLTYLNLPLIIGLLLAWISGVIYMSKYLKGITKDLQEKQKAKQELAKQAENKENVTKTLAEEKEKEVLTYEAEKQEAQQEENLEASREEIQNIGSPTNDDLVDEDDEPFFDK